MFIIETHLGRDSRGGIGVFAKHDIKKGTVVWEWNDLFDKEMTVEEFNRFSDETKEFLRHYTYSPDDRILCYNFDNTRFVNHSETPNLFEISLGVEIAVRDIKAGEELTEDYRIYDKSLNYCGRFLKVKKPAVSRLSVLE